MFYYKELNGYLNEILVRNFMIGFLTFWKSTHSEAQSLQREINQRYFFACQQTLTQFYKTNNSTCLWLKFNNDELVS